jgi:hypothetical protein
VLKTPFSGDDSPNQNLEGYIAEHHEGFWDFWWSLVTSEISDFGRFTPIGLLQTYGLHEVLHDRLTYKLILVAMTVLALLLVAAVLLVQRVPIGITALSIGGTAALFQLHNFHDSLMAYAALMQVVVIWYCVSLLWFIGWLRRGGWWRLALSVACVLGACLTYEAAYPLVVLHLAVALGERGNLKAALRASAFPLAVSFVFVVVVLYLRTAQLRGNSGYSVSTSPVPILVALGRQLSAAFPGANYLDALGPRSLPSVATFKPELRGLLIGAFLVPSLWLAAVEARSWRPAWSVRIALVVSALAFVVLPASLIAMAPRYQNELRWGVGYLPVFFSVVGLSILAALAYTAVARRLPAIPLAAVCALLIAIAAGANAEGNTRLMVAWQPTTQARDDLEDAFRAGVLDEVPADGLLLFDRGQIGYPNGPWFDAIGWSLSQWIYTHTDRSLRTLPVSTGIPLARQCQDATGATKTCAVITGPTYWFTTGTSQRLRWVAVTPIRARTFSERDNLYAVRASGRARVAVQSTSIAPGDAQFTWPRPDGSVIRAAPEASRMVARRDGWTFFDIAVPTGVAAAGGSVALPAQ